MERMVIQSSNMLLKSPGDQNMHVWNQEGPRQQQTPYKTEILKSYILPHLFPRGIRYLYSISSPKMNGQSKFSDYQCHLDEFMDTQTDQWYTQ